MNTTERRRTGSRHPSRALLVAGLLCAGFVPGAFAADAQHAPVTGEMLDGTHTPESPPLQGEGLGGDRTPESPPLQGEGLGGDGVRNTATSNASTLPDVDLAGPTDNIEAADFEESEAAQPLPEQAPMPAYANAAAPYVPPATRSNEIGSATRHLLQLQADNAIAGPPRPMLGAEASAAYQRYLDSFNHPIPEFFETNVETDSGGGK